MLDLGDDIAIVSMPGPPPPPRLPPPPAPYGFEPAGDDRRSNDNNATIMAQQQGRTMPNRTAATHLSGGGVHPPRAPPPPMMMMNRNNAINLNGMNRQQPQQFAPPPPAEVQQLRQQPSPPAAFSQHQQQFNNGSNTNNYSAPTSQFNQLNISNAPASSSAMPSAYTTNSAVQQPQQYRGGAATMPPPPPPPGMSNNYNPLTRQQPLPPPPPIQQQNFQQQQQQNQFSTNAIQPPSHHYPPQQQQQQQPPVQTMQSSSSSMMQQPPQPSRPQYNNNTNNNMNYPQSTTNSNYHHHQTNPNPKIDPSQIPRIPLFTRPHHAPATIYPSANNHTTTNNTNGMGMFHPGGGSGGGGAVLNPPPPLDSRYVFSSTSSSNNNSNMNASPRLLASTLHTFPTDHKTLRSCGDLPLGLIVTPLGSLTTLCCRSDNAGGDDDSGGVDGNFNNDGRITATSSTQWNGREQGDIYSENRINTLTCKDVDHVIAPFDGEGLVNNMSGNNDGTTNGTTKEEEKEVNDPERIPVIRGTKRSIQVTDDTANNTNKHHHHASRTKITQTIQPPRCNRCNAYLNPYCTPSSSSNSNSTTSSTLTNTFQGLIYTPTQSYNCNMCGSKSSIVISNEEYIANNLFESTALRCGTVEYEVGGEYCVRGRVVENVCLYGVEYVPEGIVGGGDQHHHHGTMKSHGWKESLDGIRNVARELCVTSPRREEDGVVVKDVKIGIFAFCRDMLVFPYIKRKGHDGSNEEDEGEEELAVAIVSDVTEDPFCPLPLNSWSYNVGNGLESKEWHRFCRVLDSFTELMEQLLSGNSHSNQQQQQQQNDIWTRNCGGAALVALSDALKESGGRGTLITTRRPNYGIGALRDREAVTNYGIGSVAEQKLFTPLQHLVQRSNDAVGMVKDKPAGLFYKKLGEECAKNRVCLDIVVTSSSVSVPSTDPKQLKRNANMREFLDVATLGELCRVTCGHFKWLRVGNECGVAVNGNSGDTFTAEQLREELKRPALAYTGSDVVFKLRCSNGVQVKSYSPTLPVGNLVGDGIVNSAELELSSMHPGTSIAVVLEHKIGGVVDTMNGGSRKGIDMPMVFFQSAVLYTTKTGQRRVRVSTLGLPTTKVPADIFRSADLGAISTIFTRGAISDIERDGGSLRLARENVFKKCVSILASYRSHTTARTSPSGQLVLPESLQLLPLFCLSLRKSRMLRHSLPKGVTSAKPFPTADERAYHIFYGRMVSPNMSLQCVHPHLFKVSDMRTRDGHWITPPVLQENKIDEANVIAASMRPVCQLPKTMNPSIACLDESGMYLLDDRFSFYLFIGRDVPDEKWQNLLAVGGVGSSRARGSSVPVGGLSLADTESAHKLRSVIHQLRMLNSPNETLGLTARNTYAPLILVFVGRGSVFEEEMDSLLVDDPDTHERSYVDFLCDIHRSVREQSDQTT